MKKSFVPIAVVMAVTLSTRAQGNFQYDQQSFIVPPALNLLLPIQQDTPIGQSFTPSLPTVGFVQFDLFDGQPNNGVGATLYVNLRSNSITGPIISSTTPVFLPDTPTGGGVTNFIFSTPASVAPGTIYFFDLVVQSGDPWRVNVAANVYPGGTLIDQGNPEPFEDAYFREGIIVPEPGMLGFVILTGMIWFYACRHRTRLTEH